MDARSSSRLQESILIMKIFESISEKNYKDSIFFTNSLLENKILYFLDTKLDHEKMCDFIKSVSGSQHSNDIHYQKDQQHNGLARVSSNSPIDSLNYYRKSNWHVDNSMIDFPHGQIPVIIAMHMRIFKCNSKYGRTIFIDREQMLNDAPVELVNWMKDGFVINLIGYDNSKGFGRCHDGYTRPLRVFPLINTHPISSSQNFLYISSQYKLFPENTYIENLYEDFTNSYLSDEKNWITIEWQENQSIVWDNRAVLHTFELGWQEGERVFDRYQSGFETPYYNNLL